MHPSRTTRIVSKLIILVVLLTGIGFTAGTAAAAPECLSCSEFYWECIGSGSSEAFCLRRLERCFNHCTP